MSSDHHHSTRAWPSLATRSVSVERSPRGLWEICLPDQPEHLACETFDQAQRLARECAADLSPCELVIHDAYHRLTRRELIDSAVG